MPIVVMCSHCQSKAKVREELAGRPVKCPKCGQVFSALAEPSTSPSLPTQPPLATPPAAQVGRPESQSSVVQVHESASPTELVSHGHDDGYDVPQNGEDETGESDGRRKRSEPLSGSGMSVVLCLALFASVILNAVFIWVAVESMGEFSRKAIPDKSVVDLEKNIVIAQWAMRVLLPLLFLVWLHNMSSNLRLLGVRGQKYSPGWAVGLWFIPIVNLYLSVPLLQELWKASDPDELDGERRSWRKRPISILAIIGCLFFWAAFLLEFVSRTTMGLAFMEMKGMSRPDFGTLVYIQGMFLAAAVSSVIASLLFILFVGRLDQRQKRKLRRLQRESDVKSEVNDGD